VALSILCDGYRAAHGDRSLPGFSGLSTAQKAVANSRSALTESGEWWLRGLGVDSLEELQTLLSEELEAGPGNPAGVDVVSKVALYLRAARKWPNAAIRRLHRVVLRELDR
jgi:hypothetical protein